MPTPYNTRRLRLRAYAEIYNKHGNAIWEGDLEPGTLLDVTGAVAHRVPKANMYASYDCHVSKDGGRSWERATLYKIPPEAIGAPNAKKVVG